MLPLIASPLASQAFTIRRCADFAILLIASFGCASPRAIYADDDVNLPRWHASAALGFLAGEPTRQII